ncbi:hypothetical protein [Mameliella sp. CS4]|uniref:hypothetical protein n=1 Tax=Mameliella sp. CS4 TaxID=2862329 RepID=UPI00210376B5|nr:hypothetical protein [Mameliella sp. CS4]
MNLPSFGIPALCALAVTFAAPAQSETAQGAHVSLELNALEPVDGACRISFLIQNGHDSDIARAVYEAVLFDTEGRVDRMTLFDFGNLPAARPRVRQFLVPGLICSDLGRLLINGAETCEAASPGACTQDLHLRSRTEVEIIG